MGKEIERKFLVNPAKWLSMEKPAGHLYRQGYLLTDPSKTVRVRLTDQSGYLTIKGITTGASRAEYEYTIPAADAVELLEGFSTALVEKMRYKILYDGHTWEVDVFSGANHGLIVAEIELTDEDETFSLPAWIGREVTEESKYYNVNLGQFPYSSWTDK